MCAGEVGPGEEMESQLGACRVIREPRSSSLARWAAQLGEFGARNDPKHMVRQPVASTSPTSSARPETSTFAAERHANRRGVLPLPASPARMSRFIRLRPP